MRNSLFILALFQSLAAAKGVTPWAPKDPPIADQQPSEERVFKWRDGGWVPTSKTGYAYDARGILVHAEAWTAEREGQRYAGTWSWDFSVGADYLLTGARERVRRDSGWKDTVALPLDVKLSYRTPKGKEETELLWDRTGIVWGVRTASEFDAAGRLASLASYQYSGGSWTQQGAANLYVYDAAGRLLREETEGAFLETHAYDAQGRLVSSVSSLWEAGAWRDNQTVSREYGPDGRLASITTRFSSDLTTALAPWTKEVHAYPAPGEHQVSGWIRDALGAWVQQSQSLDRLDARGNVVENLEYDRLPAGWEPFRKTVMRYDAADNPIERAISVKEGNAWVLTDIWRNEFDAGRRRVAEHWENYVDGEVVASAEFSYRYDARGNLLERATRQMSVGGLIAGGEKVQYDYAAATPLGPRPHAVGAAKGPVAARRGNAFLILRDRTAHDLKGRRAIPR